MGEAAAAAAAPNVWCQEEREVFISSECRNKGLGLGRSNLWDICRAHAQSQEEDLQA
jgi:hypothetical protein